MGNTTDKNKAYPLRRKLTWIILLVGLASLLVRLLINYEFHNSALLYVGIPYLISLLLIWTRPFHTGSGIPQRYANHMNSAFIVFFASSIVLFEGFICVLFFIPVYFLVVSFAYIAQRTINKRRSGSSKLSVALPVLVLVVSMEGTSEQWSLERDQQVTVSRNLSLTPEQVHHNLVQPMELRTPRHWLLRVFPMPYRIDAESLVEGDVHVIHTRYKRWFVTNTHHGQMRLLLDQVSPQRIRTRVLSDTSYFATYTNLHGTEIRLQPLADGQTRISLTIRYERKLDPAWYFQPVMKFTMRQMANFLLDEVIVRHE